MKLIELLSLDLPQLVNILLALAVYSIANRVLKSDKAHMRRVRKNFPKRIKQTTSIMEILRVSAEKLNVDRLSILEFHNGGQNLCSLDFLKFSCTYELPLNMKSIQSVYKDRYVSELSYWLSDIATGHLFYCDSQQKIFTQDRATYYYMETNDIKQFYGLAIFDNNRRPIGCITVDYLDNRLVDKNAIDKELRITSERVSQYIGR